MAALETVYAVHHFEAENDDELTFQVGEQVFVIQKDDGFGDGWWKGQNIRGQVGLFPMNYVTFQQPHQQIMEFLTPSTSDSTITTIKKPIHTQANVLDAEISESPSVRSCYSLTCPVSSFSTTAPAAAPTNANGGTALRRSVISTLFLPSLRSNPAEDWDVDQVGIWLNAMNFGGISADFKTQEITGDILLELNMNSLKELDIPTFGKRFKLHTAINALREECGYQPTNRMSTTLSTYSTDSPCIQQKTSATTLASPVTMEKHHQRSSIIDKASDYVIMDTNKQNVSNTTIPFSPSKTDMMQQVQKRQTILPMAHRSSMEIYSTRTTDENGAVTSDMEGWLYKQGCKYKKWNKRWFVLKGANLFYFKSPKDVRMKGIINLRGYKIIPDETIQPGKYCFKAQHDDERTFYFYTDLGTSMKAWISSLMKATISRDFTAPVLSSSIIPTVSLDVARRMRPRPPSVLLYRKDKSANKPSPRSFQVTYGGDQTPKEEDDLNKDSGFDSNDQEEEEEDATETHTVKNDYIEEDDDEGHLSSEECQEELAESSPWTSAEYVQWLNSISSSSCIKINQLHELRQGDVLVDILEQLSGKTVNQSPSTLDNIVAVFQFMSMEGIEIDKRIAVKDILGGNKEKIMLMLQSIWSWSLRLNDTTLSQ